MRFKLKERPEYGQVRIVKKFAWLPIRINNCLVWFEFYSVKQSYIGAGIGFNWCEFKSTRELIKK